MNHRYGCSRCGRVTVGPAERGIAVSPHRVNGCGGAMYDLDALSIPLDTLEAAHRVGGEKAVEDMVQALLREKRS